MAVIESSTVFEYVTKMSERGVDTLDAILTFAHENKIEPEVLGDLVLTDPNLMSLVIETAEGFNLIERTNRLQFE